MCQNYIPFLESTYPEIKDNIYLEYMNISRQTEATRVIIDIHVWGFQKNL